MKTRKNKKWFAIVVAVLMVTTILVSAINNRPVEGISAICAQSEECKKAAEEEEEASKKYAESTSAANEYQNKVNSLNAEVSDQEKKIEQSEKDIKDLKAEIVKTKENLAKKQEALAEMLVDQHFENEKEPIKILASSESISDLAEKATRGDTARLQIGNAAEAVRDAKIKLEEDKQKVEDLLEEQQEARKDLIAKRQEQQEFVNKYRDDAEGYAEIARAAREAQAKAIFQYQQEHLSQYTGEFYSGINTYGWQSYCPQMQDAILDDLNYPICECTSYAAMKAWEYFGFSSSMAGRLSYLGDAKYWAGSAAARGFRVDSTPSANSIGQQTDGPYGHVFWVESVDGDGINITEYNNYGSSLSHVPGDFGSRKILNGQLWMYSFIHMD